MVTEESVELKQVSPMPSVYTLSVIVILNESSSFNLSVLVKVFPETKSRSLWAARGTEGRRRDIVLQSGANVSCGTVTNHVATVHHKSPLSSLADRPKPAVRDTRSSSRAPVRDEERGTGEGRNQERLLHHH